MSIKINVKTRINNSRIKRTKTIEELIELGHSKDIIERLIKQMF